MSPTNANPAGETAGLRQRGIESRTLPNILPRLPEAVQTPTEECARILATGTRLLSHGVGILPLAARDKEPHHALLPKNDDGKPSWSLLAERHATPADLTAWLAANPDLNLGAICGERSGLAVLDLDDLDALPAWLLEAFADAPAVRTGRGMHLYLAWQPGLPTGVLHHNGRRIGELKGAGGYAVAAGSTHETGAVYAWLPDRSLDDHAPLPLTPALLALLHSLHSSPATTAERPRVKRVERSLYSLHSGLVAPRAGHEPAGTVGESLLSRDRDETALLAQTRVLGLPGAGAQVVESGKSRAFCCILPGHDEQRPSATLTMVGKDGLRLQQCVYHDWHERGGGGDAFYTLAEVYQALTTGEVRKLNGPEQATWHLRLLIAAGVMAPADVPHRELPEGENASVCKVWAGFELLLRCKWAAYQYGAPTVFSWRFAARWCGVSERIAGEAIKRLLQLGYLRIVAKERCAGREMCVFLPATMAHQRPARPTTAAGDEPATEAPRQRQGCHTCGARQVRVNGHLLCPRCQPGAAQIAREAAADHRKREVTRV